MAQYYCYCYCYCDGRLVCWASGSLSLVSGWLDRARCVGKRAVPERLWCIETVPPLKISGTINRSIYAVVRSPSFRVAMMKRNARRLSDRSASCSSRGMSRQSGIELMVSRQPSSFSSHNNAVITEKVEVSLPCLIIGSRVRQMEAARLSGLIGR